MAEVQKEERIRSTDFEGFKQVERYLQNFPLQFIFKLPQKEDGTDLTFPVLPCFRCSLERSEVTENGEGKPLIQYVIGYVVPPDGDGESNGSKKLGPSLVTACSEKGHLHFPKLPIPKTLAVLLANGGNHGGHHVSLQEYFASLD